MVQTEEIITNCKFFIEGKLINDQALILNKGIIEDIIPAHQLPENSNKKNANGNYLIPGFIDLQINGGKGAYFGSNVSEESIKIIYQSHLKYGTTSFLPTLISTSNKKILDAIEIIKECKDKHGVLGFHLEGPFLNPEKKGAHDPEHIRLPTNKELKEILKAGRDVIKMITIAPELFSDEQIKLITDESIVISAGHSTATLSQAQHFFSKGVTCVTHLFNAMSSFESKKPGLAGATLENENVWAGIIADGIHCDFVSLKIAYKLKSEKLFLVSDATFIDETLKEFELEGIKIIKKEGQYYTEKGSLAGSCITMLDAFRNCYFKAGIPLHKVIDMSSSHPAQILGIKYGKIKQGYKADLLLMNDQLEIEGIIK